MTRDYAARYRESSDPSFWVVIQARMSSSRFPGKSLATLSGQPNQARVVERIAGAVTLDRIFVATSSSDSDTLWCEGIDPPGDGEHASAPMKRINRSPHGT